MTALRLADYTGPDSEQHERHVLMLRAVELWPSWSAAQRARWVKARLRAPDTVRVDISRNSTHQVNFAGSMREAEGQGVRLRVPQNWSKS